MNSLGPEQFEKNVLVLFQHIMQEKFRYKVPSEKYLDRGMSEKQLTDWGN